GHHSRLPRSRRRESRRRRPANRGTAGLGAGGGRCQGPTRDESSGASALGAPAPAVRLLRTDVRRRWRAGAMIASVRGQVVQVSLDCCVVESGGLGYRVHATPGTLAGLRTGSEAILATSLVVREDSMTLFGFADWQERDIFEMVQTVSGVGPRLALAMLAVHSP